MKRNELKPLIESAWYETSPRLESLQRTGLGLTIKDVFKGQWGEYVLFVYTNGTYTLIRPCYNDFDSNVLEFHPVNLRIAHEHGLATEEDLSIIRELEQQLEAI